MKDLYIILYLPVGKARVEIYSIRLIRGPVRPITRHLSKRGKGFPKKVKTQHSKYERNGWELTLSA